MSMYPIASITVSGSSTGTVTFSNIPQDFTHLEIRMFGRLNYATLGDSKAVNIRFNGDSTSANYTTRYFWGSTNSIVSGTAINSGNIYSAMLPSTNFQITNWGSGIMKIFEYTNTNKTKTGITMFGHYGQNYGMVGWNQGMWNSTAAITSITLVGAGENYVSGTRFDLYAYSISPATGV